MKNFIKKIAKCSQCDSILDYRKFSYRSHVNIYSKNMIISEAPAGKSIDIDRYWSGESGSLLRDCISIFGKNLEKEFYITDVVKCWPHVNEKNIKPKKSEIINCRHFIIDEIKLIQPKNILHFGELAANLILKRKFKMKEINGTVKTFEPDVKTYFFYHPSYILRQNDKSLTMEYAFDNCN